MADNNEKDARGLTPSSQSLLKTYIDTPTEQAAAATYMEEANWLIEDPLTAKKQQVREGYEGVTKRKEELKKRTELQELIDLAVKGAVKAYAGYQGSRTGLDLSQTSIETPDRSAAYARGLENIRGTQEEVQLKERDLFRDLQTRERRLGEFQSAARQKEAQDRHAKERAEDHLSRMKEKQERLANEEKADKKLKYTAYTQLVNRDITNIDKTLEDTAGLSKALEADDLGTEAGAITTLELRAKAAKIPEKQLQEMLQEKEYSKLQMATINQLQGIKKIKQEQQKIFNNLSMTGRAATDAENKALAVFELLTEVPVLLPARDVNLPAGTIVFDITKPSLDTTDSTDFQKYDETYKSLKEREAQLPAPERKAFRERYKLDEKGSIRTYWQHVIENKGTSKEFAQILEDKNLPVPLIRQTPITKEIGSYSDIQLFRQEMGLKKLNAQPQKIGVKY